MSEETVVDIQCLICGERIEVWSSEYARCVRCGVAYDLTAAGPKIGQADWSTAFGEPAPAPLHMRPYLTRAVRDQLHEYVHGAEIPADRLRRLVALLIDMHTHAEEHGVTLAKMKYAERQRPRRGFIPPRTKAGA